jgi:hypothetical protein
VKVVDVHPDLR